MPITIDLSGPDWADDFGKFYAQRGEGKFAFGNTEVEALQRLLKEEEEAK